MHASIFATPGGIMKNFGKKIQRFLLSEDGPTAVEYAVMLALIIVVCIAMIRLVGTAANDQFDNVQQVLNSTAP
jgi:pilus assembly protein Flp/PilA